MGKYPSWTCRQLERRRLDRLITFAWHPGDVPRGIIADIIEDLGIPRDEFYFGRF